MAAEGSVASRDGGGVDDPARAYGRQLSDMLSTSLSALGSFTPITLDTSALQKLLSTLVAEVRGPGWVGGLGGRGSAPPRPARYHCRGRRRHDRQLALRL